MLSVRIHLPWAHADVVIQQFHLVFPCSKLGRNRSRASDPWTCSWFALRQRPLIVLTLLVARKYGVEGTAIPAEVPDYRRRCNLTPPRRGGLGGARSRRRQDPP